MVFDAQSVVSEREAVVGLKTWPSGARYWFDRAEYDQKTDRLHLSYGPATAACACPTPEGHVVLVAQPEGYLCGITVTDLQRRFAHRGRIDVTLPDLERVTLSLTDVAAGLSGRRVVDRRRLGGLPPAAAA